MNPTFDGLESKLESFSCLRCNECCKQPGFVYLKPGEADAIARFLGMDEYAFAESYCQLQDRQRLVLKQAVDGACIFWNDKGCSIHAVKPAQCKDFPVSWRTLKSLEYCAGIRKLLTAS